MAITIYQIDEKQFSIHPPEELTLPIVDFLRSDVSCIITDVLTRAIGHSVGSGFELENHQMKYRGLIEGHIVDSPKTVEELVAMISLYLNYKIVINPDVHTEWTLYSDEEKEDYELY